MHHPHTHYEIARERHRDRLERTRTANLATHVPRAPLPARPSRRRLRLVAVAVGSLLVLVVATAATGADHRPAPTSAIRGYEIVDHRSAFDSSDGKLVSATCPAGKKVVGGGATFNPAIRPVLLVQRTAARDGRTWTAIAREYETNGLPWNLSVRAICANASS